MPRTIDTPDFWKVANAWASATLDTAEATAALVAYIDGQLNAPRGCLETLEFQSLVDGYHHACTVHDLYQELGTGHAMDKAFGAMVKHIYDWAEA